MRRIVASGAVFALVLALSGCGDDDMGVPKDATTRKTGIDMSLKLAKMKEAMQANKPTLLLR
jgi:hypothetical protein